MRNERHILSPEVSRHWQDVFWFALFVFHMVLVGFVLEVLGFNRFMKKDRLNIDKYTMGFLENQSGLTEDYWRVYGASAGTGTLLGWIWFSLIGSHANAMMKISMRILTTYPPHFEGFDAEDEICLGLTIVFLWQVWKARNLWTIEGKKLAPYEIVQNALEWNEFNDVNRDHQKVAGNQGTAEHRQGDTLDLDPNGFIINIAVTTKGERKW